MRAPPIDPDAKPIRMHHLCKNVQKAAQNPATRLLTIIGISGPLLSGSSNAPEDRFSRIQITYHKLTPVPVVDNAAVFGAGNSQNHPDGTVVHHHGDTGTTRTVNIGNHSCAMFIVRS